MRFNTGLEIYVPSDGQMMLAGRGNDVNDPTGLMKAEFSCRGILHACFTSNAMGKLSLSTCPSCARSAATVPSNICDRWLAAPEHVLPPAGCALTPHTLDRLFCLAW